MRNISMTFLGRSCDAMSCKVSHFFNEFVQRNKNICSKMHEMIFLNPPLGFYD
jgi:hypothetical protein